MNLYEVLGVARDADEKAIRARYIALAGEHHPDRGGDTATMQDITRAYDVLHDPAKRKDYDMTGAEPGSIEAISARQLQALLKPLLEKFDPAQDGDLLAAVRTVILANTTNFGKLREEGQRDLARLRGIRDATVVKTQPDLIRPVIDELIEAGDAKLRELEAGIHVSSAMLDLLNAAEFGPGAVRKGPQTDQPRPDPAQA